MKNIDTNSELEKDASIVLTTLSQVGNWFSEKFTKFSNEVMHKFPGSIFDWNQKPTLTAPVAELETKVETEIKSDVVVLEQEEQVEVIEIFKNDESTEKTEDNEEIIVLEQNEENLSIKNVGTDLENNLKNRLVDASLTIDNTKSIKPPKPELKRDPVLCDYYVKLSESQEVLRKVAEVEVEAQVKAELKGETKAKSKPVKAEKTSYLIHHSLSFTLNYLRDEQKKLNEQYKGKGASKIKNKI